MSSSWTHLSLVALTLAQLVTSSEICLDGSAPLCSDGSKPQCLTPGDSACPKACEPHNNKCDATAPTCIFPDPRVATPRGACACRPGYKATGYASGDVTNQWRLPVEAQEHRVWVAEGVKCDTLCDVSTGVDSCLEVPLIAAECIGTGATGYNTSQQSMLGFEGGYGNYSRSLTATKTGATSEAFVDSTFASESTSEDFDQTTTGPGNPDEGEHADDAEDAGETEDAEGVIDELSEKLACDSVDTSEDLHELGEPDIDDEDDPGIPEESTLVTDDTPEDSTGAYPAAALEVDEDDNSGLAKDVPLPSGGSSNPVIEARDRNPGLPQTAEEKGRQAYEQAWAKYLKQFSKLKAMPNINMAHRPELCSVIARSVVDSCKKGVKSQVALCKQSSKGDIAQCKNDLKASIDQCKKRYKPWDPRKAACEARRAPGMAKCEAHRIDVPLCEFDRLTAGCCESTRPLASTICNAGISTEKIQRQIQSIQASCSIVTGLAKAVTKSYLTGQVLGVIIQLESVKDIGDTVQAIRKVDQTRKEMERWANGLEAAAEGKMQEAVSALGPLASQISPSIGNTMKWAEAAQTVVTKNVDAALVKLVGAADELQAIKSAKSSIETLRTVANDIGAIRSAARKCTRVPKAITPQGYPHCENVRSEKMLIAAVEAYKRAFTGPLKAAAECQAVVVRADRVLAII